MSMRPLRLVALAFGLGLALAGCSSAEPPSGRLPEMTFAHLRPYSLDVARVEVVPDYAPPSGPRHIEETMPVSPENALRRWVQDRLRPIGSQGTLRVLVHDASATETALPTDKGFSGMFKTEQASRVDVTLSVTLEVLDSQQSVLSDINTTVSRSRTTPEGMKLNERDRLLYDLVEELMKDYNMQVDQEIPTVFSRWLARY